MGTMIESILSYRPPKRKKYGTQKKGTPCPNCKKYHFDFHSGIYKSCTFCGYSNFMEGQIRRIKWLARRDRSDEVSSETFERTLEYINRIQGYDNEC